MPENDVADGCRDKMNLKDELHGRLFYSPPKQNGNNMAEGEGLNTLSKNHQTTQTAEEKLPPDSVKRIAEILAKDIVKYVAFSNDSRPADKYCETMRRTVSELSERHDILFRSMVNKLNITEKNGYQTFVNVADEIFADGAVNWGRIVSLYAFAARLASNCVENGLATYTDSVADFTGKYVGNKLAGWIHEQGGWDTFANYFPHKGSFEDRIWKGLLVTAFGLGALATMVAAR